MQLNLPTRRDPLTELGGPKSTSREDQSAETRRQGRLTAARSGGQVNPAKVDPLNHLRRRQGVASAKAVRLCRLSALYGQPSAGAAGQAHCRHVECMYQGVTRSSIRSIVDCSSTRSIR